MNGGNFTVEGTPLEGLVVVQCRAFGDERGLLFESWREEAFAAMGIPGPFVQDNHSRSGRGVLRGLHWQAPPAPQGKLVRCTRGAVWDVAVDIRAGSPTFGRFHAETLAAGDPAPKLLWVPPGFAHGFLATEAEAEVQYRCTAYWNRDAERCILWNDPDLGIPWPVAAEPVLSPKDRGGMTFAAYGREPSFRWKETA